MRILIVDNDKNTVETMKAALASRPDTEIDTAEGGAEALGRLTSGKIYDLVLLDIMMPEVSGIDVCKRMVASDAMKNVSVLLISALPIESKEFVNSLGEYDELKVVKGVLEKPFGLNDLNAKIDAILKK